MPKHPVPIGLIIGQLHHGGAERQLHALVSRLDPRCFRPFVFCLSEGTAPYGPRLEQEGVEVVVIPRRGHFDLLRAVWLARELKRRRIRLLHAFLLEANVYAALARRWAGAPALVTSNRVTVPGRGKLRRLFLRWAFASSERTVVNSEAVRSFTASLYRLPPDRIQVIHNGLDPSPFEAASREAAVRQELGAEEGDLLVGTIGRIAPQKAPELFVAAMKAIHQAEPRARFVWVGEGQRAELEALAANEGLGRFLRLPGTRSDIPRVLKALDLFVLSSRAEGLPNVVLEAMASGVSVVATDVPGTREALGDCGVICPVDDAGALASAALGLLNNLDAGGRMATCGQDRVRRLFSLPRMVEETQDLYSRVLEASAGAYPSPG